MLLDVIGAECDTGIKSGHKRGRVCDSARRRSDIRSSIALMTISLVFIRHESRFGRSTLGGFWPSSKGNIDAEVEHSDCP